MKTTLLKIILSSIIICLNFGCASADPHTKHFTNLSKHPKSRAIMVRLTTYSRTEKGCDKWTKKGKSSTGIKLKDKVSAAVDPKIIPYFSKVFIPEIKLNLFVCDTGGAVKSRLASRRNGRNEPILDLYFDRESDAKKFRLNNPEIVEALILN
jgi:3D (Asp-Asp-Asp) domain-containing protein